MRPRNAVIGTTAFAILLMICGALLSPVGRSAIRGKPAGVIAPVQIPCEWRCSTPRPER